MWGLSRDVVEVGIRSDDVRGKDRNCPVRWHRHRAVAFIEGRISQTVSGALGEKNGP